MRVMVMAEQLRRPVPGGIGTYVTGLLSGLRDLNSEGSASPGPVGAPIVEASTWATAPAGGGLDPLRAFGPVRVVNLPRRLAQRGWDLGLLSAPSDQDWCHATSLSTPGVRRGGAPLSTFVHDVAFRSHPSSFTARGRAWHERALARAVARSRVLIVPSEATALALVEAGVLASRIDIVEEGADHLPLVERHEGGFLLSVSTIEPRKNLPRLVEAYARIRHRLPEPWPLRVVGPEGWGGVDLAPTEGVELLGHVDDERLAQLLAGARCLAYVPLAEGWGLPVAEAMRAGCPVVSSEVPSAMGATEIVDPHDVDDVARGLLAVATDDALRRDLAARGRDTVRPLTWRRCAEGHRIVWETR
jgi:glycosyltransferase involved in cell wall biosynthesis